MQNEIELVPRSIRRKYVSIQQYCDYLRMVLNLNEIFFRFTARKIQLPAEAITNVLDNAVKYTPSGGIVGLEITESPSYLQLDISDNGIGIPEEEQAKIFGRFTVERIGKILN